FYRLPKHLLGNRTILFHNESVTGFHLIDLFEFNVESRLYGRPFRSSHQYLIVDVIIGRSNPCRITHNKCITMPYDTADGVPTIPGLGRFTQNTGNVEVLGNEA